MSLRYAEPEAGILAEVAEEGYNLSLIDVLRIIRKRAYIVFLVVITLVGVVTGFSLLQTPMYDGSIKILVGQEQGTSTPGNLGGDVQGLQQLTRTMAEGVSSRPIAEGVIERNNLQITSEDFLKNLKVKPIAETQFIQVDYKDSSPERARQVANATGEVFSERVSEVSPSANAITATVWERAKSSDQPVSPNLVLNIALALIGGLVLGGAAALLLENLDDSWRSPEEVEEISGVPTFGIIPEYAVPQGKEARR